MTVDPTYTAIFKGETDHSIKLIMNGFNEDGVRKSVASLVTGKTKVVLGLERYAEDFAKLIAIFTRCKLDVHA